MRVLRAEVRRGWPLALAMAGLTGVLLWSHGTDWGTRWDQLGITLRVLVVVFGPACVVIGTWYGGRSRRAGMEELLASTRRSAMARALVDVGALTVVLYAGILLGAASAAWTIVVVGGYGTWVALWYVLGVLPAVAAYTAVGYLVGRLAPWRVAAPLAGVAAYVVVGFFVYRGLLSGIATGQGSLGGVDGTVFGGSALVLGSLLLGGAALAGAAVGSVEQRPAPARSSPAAVTVGVVLAVLAGVVLPETVPSTGVGWADRANPPVTCTTDDGPRVCVLREQRALLPLATKQARSIMRRLSPLPDAPTHAGVDASTASADPTLLPMSTVPIGPFGGTDPGFVNELPSVYELLDRTRFGCVSTERDSGESLVSSWLFDDLPSEVGLWPGAPSTARRFAAATITQRLAFAGRLIGGAQHCDQALTRSAVDALPRA